MNANNAVEQATALLDRARVRRLPDPVEYALQAHDDREMLETALAAQPHRSTPKQDNQ